MDGLKRLQKLLDEAATAAQSLEGEFAQISFDPFDMESVDRAIAEMESSVDVRLGPFRGNEMVDQMANNIKLQFKDEIIAKAQDARGMKDLEND